MRAVFFLAAAIAATGCEEAKQSAPRKGAVPCKEVTIDGCQYLATIVYCGEVLTHKGNCTNHTSTATGRVVE